MCSLCTRSIFLSTRPDIVTISKLFFPLRTLQIDLDLKDKLQKSLHNYERIKLFQKCSCFSAQNLFFKMLPIIRIKKKYSRNENFSAHSYDVYFLKEFKILAKFSWN